MDPWVVAHFYEENTIEVIPTEWILQDEYEEHEERKCYFPSSKAVNTSNYKNLVKNRAEPQSDWGLYSMKTLGSFDSLDVAWAKAKKALDTDHLTSNNESNTYRNKRKRKRNPKYVTSESSFELSSTSSSTEDDLIIPSQRSQRIDRISESQIEVAKSKKSTSFSKRGAKSASKCNSDDDPLLPTTSSSLSVFDKNSIMAHEDNLQPPSKKSKKVANKQSFDSQLMLSPSSGNRGIFSQVKNSTHKDSERLSRLCSGTYRDARKSSFAESCRPVHSPEPNRNSNTQTDNNAPGSSTPISLPKSKDNNDADELSSLLQNLSRSEKISLDKSLVHIIRNLLVIRNILDTHTDNFNRLFDQISRQQESEPAIGNQEVQNIINLMPIESEEKLLQIENFLGVEKNFVDFAKELSYHGGDSAEAMTKQLMYRILTNSFGKGYSWEGARGKKIFKNTRLSKAIIRAVRINKRTEFEGDDKIIKAIKKWLVRARERSENDIRKTM